MTIVNRCAHSGNVYECVAPYKIIRTPQGLVKVRDKDGKAGVRITRPDGVVIFRPNDYYENF